mmetsp:Transcript_2001/g.7207  ORF Transcript_2001/g.7207 Transcript_2001/m.7207 type:complete len:91 (+) Transcript_2001:575-847(+)
MSFHFSGHALLPKTQSLHDMNFWKKDNFQAPGRYALYMRIFDVRVVLQSKVQIVHHRQTDQTYFVPYRALNTSPKYARSDLCPHGNESRE